MFTGIITDIGMATEIEHIDGLLRFHVATSYDITTIDLGASIAHNGVCLTVVSKTDTGYWVEASQETQTKTTFANLQQGALLNLERPLCIGDELGGHMVQGHVDAVAELLSITKADQSHMLTFKAPETLQHFIAHKGSVTLDGVSLTVNDVNGAEFTVNIIPHTWEHTNFHQLSKGQRVNLEIDVIARYVSRLEQAFSA